MYVCRYIMNKCLRSVYIWIRVCTYGYVSMYVGVHTHMHVW